MRTIAGFETLVLADRANPQLLVRITDDEGTTGTGETWWGHYRPDLEPGVPVRPYQALIDAVLGPSIIGRRIDDVADISATWDHLLRTVYQYGDEGIVRGAISGIDIALWDLIGRRLGSPVAAVIGRVHDRVPVYASLTWHGAVAAILDDVSAAVDAGFAAVKLHESDPDVILEVRDTVAASVALMVDVSAACDEAGSTALATALAPAGLHWIEEPLFPQRDHAALARVRAASRVPIAAGENEFSAAGIAALLEATAIDVVQPEIAKIGGLTEALRVEAVVDHHGAALAPHNYSLGPSFLASWHWAACAVATRWLEVPWLPAGQSFPGTVERPTVTAGTIGVPPGPGLGLG